MSESDNAAEWVRIMAQRYRWGDDLDAITAEAEELTPRERRVSSGSSSNCFSRGS